MKTFNFVDTIIGVPSVAESERVYQRMQKRVKHHCIVMAVVYVLCAALLMWLNPKMNACALPWMVLSYYYLWDGQQWFLKTIEELVERTKMAVHTQEMLNEMEKIIKCSNG